LLFIEIFYNYAAFPNKISVYLTPCHSNTITGNLDNCVFFCSKFSVWRPQKLPVFDASRILSWNSWRL